MFVHARNSAKGRSVTKRRAKNYVKVEVWVHAFLCFWIRWWQMAAARHGPPGKELRFTSSMRLDGAQDFA